MDKQKQKYQRIARIGLVAFAVIVAAPLITMLVQGLVGLAIAGVVGLSIISFTPVLSTQFAVWKIKGLKAVARANPVETLQTVYIEKKQALASFKSRIQTFNAEVKTFSDRVEQFKVTYPAEAATFVAHLDKMLQLLGLREAEYKKAQLALTKFEGEIQRADSIWKMSEAAAAVSKSAGFDADEVYAKIKTETAVEQVQLTLNKAFAQLDTALLEQESLGQPEWLPPVGALRGELSLDQVQIRS